MGTSCSGHILGTVFIDTDIDVVVTRIVGWYVVRAACPSLSSLSPVSLPSLSLSSFFFLTPLSPLSLSSLFSLLSLAPPTPNPTHTRPDRPPERRRLQEGNGRGAGLGGRAPGALPFLANARAPRGARRRSRRVRRGGTLGDALPSRCRGREAVLVGAQREGPAGTR